MPVSIIIPSLNSPTISDTIDHLALQENIADIGEILVVGKDDKGLLGQRDKVRFIDTGERVGASRARNLGIQQARHELMLFIDSDCLPGPRWLTEHLDAQRAGKSIVGGGVMPVGENYWSLAYNLSLFHEFLSILPDGEREYLPSLNMSVQRRVIREVGNFDESLLRGQDIDWTTRMRRAGYSLYFSRKASVRHVHGRTSLAGMWRDCARSGYFMRRIRLGHSDMLQAPFWLRSRLAVLILAPFIAAAVTLRIILHTPGLLWLGWKEIPAIYLTKLAWCWGATRSRNDALTEAGKTAKPMSS